MDISRVLRPIVIVALLLGSQSVVAQVVGPAIDDAMVSADATTGAARPRFNETADADADVTAAIAAARASHRHVLLIMGGNWCHDSNALLDVLARPRTQAMIAARYVVVLVNVGHFDRNLDIARRFGLDGIHGTPTVLIVDSDGHAINIDDAPRWRNAQSRKPDAIHRQLERAVPTTP